MRINRKIDLHLNQQQFLCVLIIIKNEQKDRELHFSPSQPPFLHRHAHTNRNAWWSLPLPSTNSDSSTKGKHLVLKDCV